MKIATIGFFDGVHRGHRFLFEHLRALAEEHGLQPLIVTFASHPRLVLQSDYRPRLITTLDERRRLLQAYGEVLVLQFEEVQPLTAQQFMERLHTQYGVQMLLMGYDHRFGSDRLVRPQDYRRIGSRCGVEVVTMSEFIAGEFHVSSTEIRQALETGNMVLAQELLGRPYALTGTVVRGRGIGHTIGFPTANIQPDSGDKIIPLNGVYAVEVQWADGQRAQALCNIGTNPTVGNSERTIEVFIPGFEGDLYGETLILDFMRYIREERRFDSLDALRAQIKRDLAYIPGGGPGGGFPG